MKTCFKCGVVKNHIDFYRHPKMKDGVIGKCKSCAKKDAAAYRGVMANKPEWVAKKRSQGRIYQEIRRKLGTAAKTLPVFKKAWKQRNKIKLSAESKALRVKQKTNICELCNSIGLKLYRHHPDYSKPLNIRWLCSKCHGYIHRKDVQMPGFSVIVNSI